MKYLNQKLKRDVFKNWTQFFSVFLMALLCVLIYVGLEGVWYGMNTSINTYIDETNLADAWLHATNFTEDNINSIMNIDGVNDVSLKTRINVSQIDNQNYGYLTLETPGSKNISIPVIIDGLDISPSLNGLWLNLEYADANNISVGDEITLEFNNEQRILEVFGIIQSPDKMYFTGTRDFVAPNEKMYGYGIINDDTLQHYFNFAGQPNIMEIKENKNNVREQAPTILEESYISYYNRDTLFDVSNAIERSGQIQGLSVLFSFIFILLSILAMYTTIKRLIETQTKDIATLKALGYTNNRIGLHYASFGLLVGGLGSVIGLLLAPIISFIVLQTQKTMFSLPTWRITYTPMSLIIVLFVMSVCIVAAYIASKNARKGLPVVYLRGNSIKKGKVIVLEKVKYIWDRLTYGSRWAWRDSMSNPVRILMGIIGVCGCMMLLMAGFGMPDTSINK